MNSKLTTLILTLAIGSAAAPAAGASGEAEAPTCNGKPATYVGTDGKDRVSDEDLADKNPVLVLGDGDDRVALAGYEGVFGELTVCAGPGDDKVELFDGSLSKPAWIDGGEGRDRLGNADDPDYSDLPKLEIYGGSGRDVLRGADREDLLHGGNGRDKAYGLASNDEMRGGRGNDMLRGLGSSDRLYGGPGDDRLKGDDRYYTGGDDFADGGMGDDRCRAETKRRCER